MPCDNEILSLTKKNQYYLSISQKRNVYLIAGHLSCTAYTDDYFDQPSEESDQIDKLNQTNDLLRIMKREKNQVQMNK